jgi:hypothetical protein
MPSIAQRPLILNIAACVASGATVSDATIDSACQHGGVSREAFDAVVAALKNESQSQPPAKAASPPSRSKGSNQMFHSEKKLGPASRAFWAQVEEKIEAGKSREKAIEQTVMQEPRLHQEMLSETNLRLHR